MAEPIGASSSARRGRSSAGSRAVKKLRMAARADPGAPLPPRRPLRLRILGHSSRTSTAISPEHGRPVTDQHAETPAALNQAEQKVRPSADKPAHCVPLSAACRTQDGHPCEAPQMVQHCLECFLLT